jgi:hypothetical protein
MRKIIPLIQGRFLLILEAIVLLAIIALHPGHAKAGGVYNPDNYNAYRQMQRDMERPMITPPGPSRHFNYRDEDGFSHNCRHYGDTLECQD